MDLDAGDVQQRFDAALKRKPWEFNNRYESISVLILYWQHSDHPGFEKEGHNIGNLFHRKCSYNVEYYPIPSENSHMQLDIRLNQFLKEYGGPDRLIIIHYGGHGDEDRSGGRLAVWAALRQDGPTVDWSVLQPKCWYVNAHVLLLLDCCFAAQAGRSNNHRVISSNMQLLAACAMGVKSPLPGSGSFTANLIRHIESSLDSKGFADISDICNALTECNSGYERSPVHLQGLKESVRLQAFDNNPSKELVTEQGAAYVGIRILLQKKLTDSSIVDFIEWLKKFPFRSESLMAAEYFDNPVNNSTYYQIGGARLLHDETNQQPTAVANDDVSAARLRFSAMLANSPPQIASLPPNVDRYSLDGEKYQQYAKAEIIGLFAALPKVEDALSSLRTAGRQSTKASPKLAEATEDPHMQDLGLGLLIHERLGTPAPSHTDVSQRTNYPSRDNHLQSTSSSAEDLKPKRKSGAGDTSDTQSSAEMISLERRPSRSPLEITLPTGSQDNLQISDKQLQDKAVATRHLLDQVAKADLGMTTHLIGRGADVNHVVEGSSSTPLLIAAKLGHSQLCLELLKNEAYINAKDKHGRNVLHLALSDNGKEDVVSCFLNYEPDLNAQDEDGKTPLHYCVELDKRDAAKDLLCKGAVTEITSRTGETPLSLAIRLCRGKLVEILLSHGAKVRDTNEENTSQDIKYILSKHRESQSEECRLVEQRTSIPASPNRFPREITWKIRHHRR